MKKKGSLILAVLLAVSLLSGCFAAQAEAALKPGYTVNERETPLFAKLPEKHYDVNAVVEYDREHFVRFSDPQTGFWGLGLKKECCPAGAEDLPFNYENAAEILLKNAGYDSATGARFDVKITLDKITYAALPGIEVNGEADALGVFGFSRGMETVGFLSGWGVRALRDENGEIVRGGDVWSVQDEAAYDTALLCTQAEFSVTPVSANGAPIAPQKLNGFFWTAADLDTAQAEGAAEGEKVYEPGAFDESLLLKDGFSFSYTVQEGHHLAFRGEEYENDCIASAGVLTGDPAAVPAQPEKRFSSVILSQKSETARAVWRGCGSEYAPARTELFFSAGVEEEEEEDLDSLEPVQKTRYTVRYLDRETGEEIKASLRIGDRPLNVRITVNGPETIGDYELDSDASLTLRMKANEKENVFTFYYVCPLTEYTVRYIDEETGEDLVAPKTVTGEKAGSEITESAVDIDGYDLTSKESQSITIARDADQNLIKFYYRKAISSYEVRYLEEGTEKELAPSKTVTNQEVGSSVTEIAIDIDGYDLTSEESQSITIARDANQNVIKFYYRKAVSSYEVQYLEEGTEKQLAEPKKVTNQSVGSSVTERAIDIDGYDLTSEGSQSIIIASDASQNVIKFYYRRPVSSYEVLYQEEGTEKQLADPKTVKDQAVGSTVTEGAIEIRNYDLVSEGSQSITLVRDASRNVIKFYYKKALTDYTVKYLEEGTDKVLANPKTVTGKEVDSEVEESAIGITDYDLVSSTPQSITLVRDASRNVIKFYYRKATADYTVYYLEEGTEKNLAETKIVKNQPVGGNVSESAVGIEGYSLVSSSPMGITLVRDTAKNVIRFYYKKDLTDYTVMYLVKSTEEVLEARTVSDKPAGATVTESAPSEIGDYNLVSSSPKSITLAKDSNANVIKFYYDLALTSYTIHYQDYSTHEDIKDPETVENVAVGVPKTVSAGKISGYNNKAATTKRITPKRDPAENVVIFYFTKAN